MILKGKQLELHVKKLIKELKQWKKKNLKQNILLMKKGI